MRIFITGATGFIGGKLALKLRADGHEVVAVARNPGKAGALTAAGVQVVAGDITERETLREPMQGCDAVYHVAGWYKVGQRDSSPAQAINVEGTRNVLEMMRLTGVPKGVYTSTLAINSDTRGVERDETYHFTGEHLSEYDRTKALAHVVAESFIREGLPLVIVQPGMVYGPDDGGPSHDIWSSYVRRRLPMVPKGIAYSWGHVDDIVDGHVLAFEKGAIGESYIICGPSHTLIDALLIAQSICGIKPPMLHPAPGLLKAMSGLTKPIERVIPLPETFTSEYLRLAAGVTYLGNNAKARAALGFNPRPLETGLRPVLAWELQQAGSPVPPDLAV